MTLSELLKNVEITDLLILIFMVDCSRILVELHKIGGI